MDKERELLLCQRRADEYRRQSTIKDEARQLRIEEIKRLSQAWLTSSNSYYSMTSQQFEDAVAALFRKLGYAVKQTPYSNDGGKDAILTKDDKKYLVECKRYKGSNCIGRPDLQKFVAAMHDEGAVSGFYVNTGIFSSEAKKYAETHNIELFDRLTFPRLVNQAYPMPTDTSIGKTMCTECGSVLEFPIADTALTGSCPQGHTVTSNITKSDLGVFNFSNSGVPHCEKCGSSMRLVKTYGRSFWGCTKYPSCRFTRRFAGANKAASAQH